MGGDKVEIERKTERKRVSKIVRGRAKEIEKISGKEFEAKYLKMVG